jgi:hypothetical protein
MGAQKVRVYKLKAFARFQHRERISDASLVKVINGAEDAVVDADLGGGLIKQRISSLSLKMTGTTLQ